MLLLVALLVLAFALGPAGLALGCKTHNLEIALIMTGIGFIISLFAEFGMISYNMGQLFQPGAKGGKVYLGTTTARRLEYLIRFALFIAICSLSECFLAITLYSAGVI